MGLVNSITYTVIHVVVVAVKAAIIQTFQTSFTVDIVVVSMAKPILHALRKHRRPQKGRAGCMFSLTVVYIEQLFTTRFSSLASSS